MRYTHIGIDDQARAVAAIPAPGPPHPHQADTESWEHIGSKTCGTPCHLSSSADNRVTMELATTQEENPCVNRGSGVICPPLALDGTKGGKWRWRESNPQAESRNSEVASGYGNCSRTWEYPGSGKMTPIVNRWHSDTKNWPS
jgi:hypothetical protein